MNVSITHLVNLFVSFYFVFIFFIFLVFFFFCISVKSYRGKQRLNLNRKNSMNSFLFMCRLVYLLKSIGNNIFSSSLFLINNLNIMKNKSYWICVNAWNNNENKEKLCFIIRFLFLCFVSFHFDIYFSLNFKLFQLYWWRGWM